jgi:hypothetical protein
MGVFGLRKVGKTSLLKETERRFTELGSIVVYIDLLRVPGDVPGCRWLYWRIADQLHQQVTQSGLQSFRWRLGGRFGDYLEVPPNYPVMTAFDADLTHILRAIQETEISPHPKVVLLLDEIERLIPSPARGDDSEHCFDFFSYIRGVSQEDDNFVVIVTGANAAISEAAQFDGRDNPVFNYFREIYLQLLEPAECTMMLRVLGRGMGIRFSADASAAIYELTGGHPFFARQLCSFLAHHYEDRPLHISAMQIDAVLDQYLSVAGRDFQEIMERLARDYPHEKEVCVQLAKAEGGLPMREVIGTSSRLGTSLRHLVGYQLVRVQKDKVSLSMGLLRHWIRRMYSDGE